jgi:hypothetical protein
MKEIKKEKFYNIINDLDVCVYSKLSSDKKMMITDFKFRNGVLLGQSLHNYDLDDDNYGERIYKINEVYLKGES